MTNIKNELLVKNQSCKDVTLIAKKRDPKISLLVYSEFKNYLGGRRVGI